MYVLCCVMLSDVLFEETSPLAPESRETFKGPE